MKRILTFLSTFCLILSSFGLTPASSDISYITMKDYLIDQNGYDQLLSVDVAKNLNTNTSYSTLKEAVQYATSGDTIAMIGNDTIDSPIIIDKNINLIAQGGNRIISRKTNYSDTMFFVSNSIEFNVGNDNFTDTLFIDGNNVNAVKPMINTEYGKIKIKKAVLQNAKSVNSVNSGGAVSSKSDVIVDGSIFRNNYSNAYGGAIDALGKVIADSCWFTDNYAGKSGGAISSYFSVELHKEARFENNRADDHGGAIYTIGKVIADSCWFTGNYANDRGGAIFSDSVLIKGNAYFENDTANNESGGAIYAYKNVQIEGNSTFTGNYANVEGGAIFSWRSVELHKEARFENNRADSLGGAIYAKGKVKADSCWFKGNYAKNSGGAIYSDSTVVLNKEARFENNLVEFDGGAIHTKDSVLISGNAYFGNNTVINTYHVSDVGNGGAIYAEKNVQIEGNSTFIGNSAKRKGGAIYSDSTVVLHNEVRFENNSAENADGGAIYAKGKVIADNCWFTGNYAGHNGGAICSNSTVLIKGNASFENNNAYWGGGAIYSASSVLIKGNASFENNRTKYGGGAIYAYKNVQIDGNSTFIDNYTDASFGYGGLGGAIWSYGSVVLHKESRFENNRAVEGYGGAIYANNVQIDGNSTFKGNYAGSKGGAIYADGSVELHKEARFENNRAENADGGAIYAKGKVTADSCWFTGNYTGYNGGAIYSIDSVLISGNAYFENDTAKYAPGGAIYTKKNVQIDGNSTFKGNYTGSNGGAIYADGSVELHKEARFENNRANNGPGGAISANGNVIADSCWFTGNYATKEGGAIYALDSVLIRGNATFENDTAKSYPGGAIYAYNNVKIDGNSTFKGNYTGFNGGAIYAVGSVELHKEARFENNRAKNGPGGAISANGKVIADSCWFTGNYATKEGGAIYAVDSVLIRGNATFENDTAKSYPGGAIYAYNNVKIDGNSTFTGNYTGSNGGAIYAVGSVELHKEARFENNRANFHGGAIYAVKNVQIDGNSTFKGNYSELGGGAIYSASSVVLNNKARFENNRTDQAGGAINAIEVIADTDSCWFTGNYAYHGGAIYSDSSVLIRGNAYFENDTADYYSGAIYAEEIVQIDGNSTFKGNYAGEDGGAIYSRDSVVLNNKARFENNWAVENGGAIYAKDVVIVDSCWFNDNFAKKSGGAIYSDSTVVLNKDARFENNRANFGNGGAIYAKGKVKADSCWFTGNYSKYDGGAIYSKDSVLILENAYFENDTANEQNGGAIYAVKNVKIDGNSTFKGNYADEGGGAIYSDSTVELNKEARFENNWSDLIGGAICAKGKVIADSCLFKDNYAFRAGGAIYAYKNIQIDGNSIFTGNYSKIDGGAIYSDDSVLISGNAYFENDTAKNELGGAIYAVKNVQIDGNSTFKGNYSELGGGAIYSASSVVLNNKARFENNWAVENGGAIFAVGYIMLDSGIVFENNYAKFGDAIFLQDTLVISDADMFINDTIYLDAPSHTTKAAIKLNTTTALSNIQLEFDLAYYIAVPYKVLFGTPEQLTANHFRFIPDSIEKYFIDQEGYLTTREIEVLIETRHDGSTPNWETRYNEIGVFFHDNDADGSIDSVSYPVAFSIEKASNLGLVADNQIWLTFAFKHVGATIQYHIDTVNNITTDLYVDAINPLPTPSVYDSTYIVSIPLSDTINTDDVIVNALNFDTEFENKWKVIINATNYLTTLNRLVGVASTPESPVSAARIAQGNHGASGVVFSATEGNGAISYNPADYSYWAPQTHTPQDSVWVSVDVTRPADTIHNVYLNWKNRLDNLTTTEDLYTDTSFIDYFEIGANHNPAAKDYTFDTTSRSWGDSANGNYKIYWFDADTALQAIETITISRQAAPTYQVQFNYNGGGDACNTEPTYTDTTVIFGRPLKRPEDPFKSCYVFMDWHNENNALFPVDSFANVRADGDTTFAFGTRRDMVLDAHWNYYLTLTNPLDTAVIANYGVCEIPTRDYVTNPPAYTYTYNEDYSGKTYLDYNDTEAEGNYPCIDQDVYPFDYGTFNDGTGFSARIWIDTDTLAVEQTYTITWSIRDFCDSIHVLSQVVKVKFPPCGNTNYQIGGYDRTINDYTPISDPFKVEYDSYDYSTVRMGCDCWTAENLQNATDAVDNATEGKPYYHFTEDLSNTAENTAEYGLLYSWNAAMANTTTTTNGLGAEKTQGICPNGWYLPELTDWQSVIDVNDMYALMSTAQSSYWLGTENATNTTGFGVKPAGFYHPTDQLFYNIYGEGYFWTSTHEGINATCIKFGYNCPIVMVEEHFKPTGYSIRCVKDSRIRVFPRPR